MSPQEAELLAGAVSPPLASGDRWDPCRSGSRETRAVEKLFDRRAAARGAALRVISAADRDTRGTEVLVADLVRHAARHGSAHVGSAAAKGALDAVIALIARDLIDDSRGSEWGWQEYGVLVESWAAVLGAAHPDDR